MRFLFLVLLASFTLVGCIASPHSDANPASTTDGGADAERTDAAAINPPSGPLPCGYTTCDRATQYCQIYGGCPMFEPGCTLPTTYQCVALDQCVSCACPQLNETACGCTEDGGITLSCARY